MSADSAGISIVENSVLLLLDCLLQEVQCEVTVKTTKFSLHVFFQPVIEYVGKMWETFFLFFF